MNNDIRPRQPEVSETPRGNQEYPSPPQPVSTQNPQPNSPVHQTTQPEIRGAELPKVDLDELPEPYSSRRWHQSKWLRFTLSIVVMLLVAGILATSWAVSQLKPVSADSSQMVSVTVADGATSADLAEELANKGLIRNQQVFELYIRVTGAAANLKAGTYQLSPAKDAAAIIEILSSGASQSFNITFVPGKTLSDYRKTLLDAGFDETEIDTAFTRDYSGILFQGRPAGTDIEGYIYPETYQFATNATVTEVLEFTFREFERVIAANDLIAAYQREGLSLRDGIILASIIEREAASTAEMAQISQVFHLRLDRTMPLGSDPTYQYIADKTGVPRDTRLDSPYNTRIVTGLTPTPIASPSEAALLAAGSPASGDYVYFVHGDDGKIRYARTNAEHEQNVAKYCIELCKML